MARTGDTMDFFAEQDKARRRGRFLVVLFVLAVAATILAVDGVVALVHHVFTLWLDRADTSLSSEFIIKLSIFQAVVIVGAGVYRMLKLNGGGVSLVWGMGASVVDDEADSLAWQRLRNVVEETAIAAGVPVPGIFVMENEPGINAFAAGYSLGDAAICVTDGALELLNRDELQGVIAHEFSHILNGDMRLNIRLMSGLFGIMGVGIVGHRMVDMVMGMGPAPVSAETGRRDGSMQAVMLLAGIIAITYGFFGSLFGRMVQAAISRSRESLADASAVQFTRQTDGIGGALKKIAASRSGSRVTLFDVREVTHMMLGSPFQWRLFDSHPPLPARVRALGERWSEAEIRQLAEKLRRMRRSPKLQPLGQATRPVSMADDMPASGGIPAAGEPDPLVDFGERIGQPGPADFLAASELLAALPADVVSAVRDPWQAGTVLLALVMDRDAVVRSKQAALIKSMFGAVVATAAGRMTRYMDDLPPNQRLPLATLAFPALRRQAAVHVERLLATTAQLVRADGHVSVHEFCLQRLVQVQLEAMLHPRQRQAAHRKSLLECRDSVATLCAIVALRGDSGTKSSSALAAAIRKLFPGWHGQVKVPDDWQGSMDTCLDDLAGLRDTHRKAVVEAIALVIHHDKKITLAESELFRVIAMTLGCPMPLRYAD